LKKPATTSGANASCFEEEEDSGGGKALTGEEEAEVAALASEDVLS